MSIESTVRRPVGENGRRPRVSIVFVNFNGATDLPEALSSLEEQSLPAFEIILVDNGSTDHSLEWVRSHYPTVRILALNENRGFGAGNNAGLAFASGEYLLVTNYDARFSPVFLEELVKAADARPDVGLVCPLILHHDKPEIVQTVGLRLQIAGHAFSRNNGVPLSAWEQVEDLESANGCCFLMTRAAYEDLGGFDEEFHRLDERFFFSSLEDADLSLRALRKGYRIVLAPAAKMYHKYRQKGMTPLRFVYLEKGRYRLLRRHLTWWSLAALGPALLMGELLSIAFCFSAGVPFLREKWLAWRWIREGLRGTANAGPRTTDAELQRDLVVIRGLSSVTELRHMRGAAVWRIAGERAVTAYFVYAKRWALTVLEGVVGDR